MNLAGDLEAGKRSPSESKQLERDYLESLASFEAVSWLSSTLSAIHEAREGDSFLQEKDGV